jgi:hypothetical protein
MQTLPLPQVDAPWSGCSGTQSTTVQHSLEGMHASPHIRWPLLHEKLQAKPRQTAVPFATVGQGVQDGPHEWTL